MVPEGVDKDLTPAGELATEDLVRAVRLIERPTFVLHRPTQVLCCMLVLETLDSRPLGPLKKKPDHQVVEASIDEIVDDRSQRGFSAKLFEPAHLGRERDAGRTGRQGGGGPAGCAAENG